MLSTLKTWQFLGYLGLIPFLACLWLSQTSLLDESVKPQQAFIFYSVTILSFLSGTLWHSHPSSNNNKPLIISNILCLFAFGCLLLTISKALLLLPLGYLSVLMTEYLLFKRDTRHLKSYLFMRIVLTLIVSALHFIAYYIWA